MQLPARLLDALSGFALIAIAALFFSQTTGQFAGVELARNPMTFPRFLLALLGLGGLLLLLRGLLPRGSNSTDATSAPDMNWRAIGLMSGLSGAYLLAFQPVGFIPSTLVFLPLASLLLGYRKGWVIALATVMTAVVIWFVFARGFSIRPPGPGFDDLSLLFDRSTP